MANTFFLTAVHVLTIALNVSSSIRTVELLSFIAQMCHQHCVVERTLALFAKLMISSFVFSYRHIIKLRSNSTASRI
jgi:hypothetical protein